MEPQFNTQVIYGALRDLLDVATSLEDEGNLGFNSIRIYVSVIADELGIDPEED